MKPTTSAVRAAAKHAHSMGFTVLPIKGKYPLHQAVKAAVGDAKWSRLRGQPWEKVSKAFTDGRGFHPKVEGWGIEWVEPYLCFDFDDTKVWQEFQSLVEKAGRGERLTEILKGYSTQTPRGIRFAVRCVAAASSGALAQQFVYDAKGNHELDNQGKPRRRSLIDVKGPGGYTVEYPSFGSAHPSGKAYGPQRGKLETVVEIDGDELQFLFDTATHLDECGGKRVFAARPTRPTGEPLKVGPEHRWHEGKPCPVCDGIQKKGHPKHGHCFGYEHPTMPLIVYCSEHDYEEARVGGIGCYQHRLQGRCPCGERHGKKVHIESPGTEEEQVFEEDYAALSYFDSIGLTFVRGNQNRLAHVGEKTGAVIRQSLQSANEAFRNKKVWVAVEDDDGISIQPVSALKYWLSYQGERDGNEDAEGYCYTDAVPHMHIHNGKLNLWRGPASIPNEGEVDLFVAHIERICGKRKDLALFLKRYVAWHIKHPTQKSEVAVFLNGMPGSGKNTLTYGLSKVWHPSHSVELHDDAILESGGFNATTESASLLVLDEAVFTKSPKQMDKLKSLITANLRHVNEKYVPERVIENMLTVILLSNHSQIRMESADRRYCIIEMATELAGDFAYFDALYEEIEAPHFPGALLAWGRGLKLPAGWTPAKAVVQLQHDEQVSAREQALSPIAKWTRGLLRGTPQLPWGGDPVELEVLRTDAAKVLLELGERPEDIAFETGSRRLNRQLRDHLGATVKTRKIKGYQHYRVYLPERKSAIEKWISVTRVAF